VISRGHALVKRLRLLRSDPACRAEQGVFVAEGIHLAEEALRAGAAIETALVAPGLKDAALRAALAGRAERFEEAPDELLGALQDARSAQPVLLVVRRRDLPPRDGVPLVVVAVGVQDPGNLGTLLRSADAAGATDFLACGGADPHHPRAVRATMGAIFRLACSRVSFGDAAAALRARAVPLVGADAAGEVDYAAFDWTGPVAIVLGGEGSGLAAVPRGALRSSVRIPMREGSESLSVAAAGAVLLFEAARARRVTTGG
jgi:TrmH family RNA methyltransferase